jgi:hypothetical protein
MADFMDRYNPGKKYPLENVNMLLKWMNFVVRVWRLEV